MRVTCFSEILAFHVGTSAPYNLISALYSRISVVKTILNCIIKF